MDDELAELRNRLEAISETLAERAMAALRDALESGDPDAPREERRLTRARRAVDKAAAILAGPDQGD